METDYVVGTLDAVDLVLAAFFIFFLGLVFYLRREDRREGYPLISEATGLPEPSGAIWIPDPKVFRLEDGRTVQAPQPDGRRDTREIAAEPMFPWPGAPLRPTGDPMKDAVGAAAYSQREDVPDLLLDGTPRIVPMRVATQFRVAEGDVDLRGVNVITPDHKVAGTITDIWVDQMESLIRYLEVQPESGGGTVLLPMTFARMRRRFRVHEVLVDAILSHQFADVPKLANPDRITRLEEDKVMAYFGGGHLYAMPSRQEPIA